MPVGVCVCVAVGVALLQRLQLAGVGLCSKSGSDRLSQEVEDVEHCAMTWMSGSDWVQEIKNKKEIVGVSKVSKVEQVWARHSLNSCMLSSFMRLQFWAAQHAHGNAAQATGASLHAECYQHITDYHAVLRTCADVRVVMAAAGRW